MGITNGTDHPTIVHSSGMDHEGMGTMREEVISGEVRRVLRVDEEGYIILSARDVWRIAKEIVRGIDGGAGEGRREREMIERRTLDLIDECLDELSEGMNAMGNLVEELLVRMGEVERAVERLEGRVPIPAAGDEAEERGKKER